MEVNLARVPFTAAEEQTITSTARWMRFIAVVGLVAGFLMLFFLVLGVGLWSAALTLRSSSPQLAGAARFFDEWAPLLYPVAFVFLLAVVVTLWQNFSLYHAGDYFNLVARTDVADIDYLAGGLDKLRTYFKIQVLASVVTVAVAIGTGVVFVVLSRPSP